MDNYSGGLQNQMESNNHLQQVHHHQSGGCASFQQQPPIGIHPQDVFSLSPMESIALKKPSPYGNDSKYSFNQKDSSSTYKQHISSKSMSKPGSALQESSHVYSAVYSGVSVFEMMCRNVAVMRRQKDSYLNATQVLKVANIDKGKRTKILEKEILNKEHEKVQGGYGKYQGTWIPFERGLELARQFRVDDVLRPLFDFVPSEDQILNQPPPQTRPSSRRNTNNSTTTNVNAIPSSESRVNYIEPSNKRIKMDSTQTFVDSPENQTRDLYVEEPDFGEQQQQFFEFHESKLYPHSPHMPLHPYQNYYNIDPYGIHHQFSNHHMPMETPHIAAAAENSAERHRASIMSLFLNHGTHSPDLVLSSHTLMAPDFDINLILDDQGHTALHWASALANVKLIPSLLQKGARLDFLNYAGESALIRSVMVSHNYEQQSFMDLLSVSKDIICIPDKKNRTVLHHICLSASSKMRVNSCIYYMHCILGFYAKSVHDEAVSSEMVHSDSQNSLSNRFRSILNVVDICGDTAVNIASRLGNRHLFDLLVEAGADVSIPNYATLKPSDYGFEALTRSLMPINDSLQPIPVMTTVLYPSIKSDQENAIYADQRPPHSEKSQSEIIAELQHQLSMISREVSHYRKTIGPLEIENSEIPLLKNRIHMLENAIKENASGKNETKSSKKSPSQETISLNDEILRLRESLAHQKAVEAHLCQEIKTLRATASQHESFCRRIISECCSVPLQNVSEILEPLLECVEMSDSFNLDSRLVASFMKGIREVDAKVQESSIVISE